MLRNYDDQVLDRLMRVAERVAVNGAEVELKWSTPACRTGTLDPWVLRQIESAQHEMSRIPGRVRGTRLLLRLLLRPRSLFLELRRLGERAQAEMSEPEPDPTLGPVDIGFEDVVLWRNVNRLWWYRAPSTTKGMRPAFLHLHGGGFFAGRPTGGDPLLKFIAGRSGAAVFDLDYSLSPEFTFPHAVNEVYAAIEHLHCHADRYGIDRQRIVVGGGSAGGNLTAAAMLAMRDRDGPDVALQILINPALVLGRSLPPRFRWPREDYVTEPQTRNLIGKLKDPGRSLPMAVMSRMYRGDERSDNPLLSPLFAENLGGVPPALVFTAEMDPLRSEAEFYAGELIAAGVPVRTIRYMGTTHTTPALFGDAPQAEAIAMEIIGAISSLSTDSTNDGVGRRDGIG